MTLVYVALGGAFGAVLRYLAGIICKPWSDTFPYSTLVVNIVGSLLMGMLAVGLAKLPLAQQENLRLLLAVGVLGGFTTFSTFSLETVALIERGNVLLALLYVLASVAGAIVGLMAGMWMMRSGAAL